MKSKDYICGVSIIIFDQIIKQLISNKYITIIPKLLSFEYTKNTGGAFGIGKISFVTIASVLIIIGIIAFIIKEKNNITYYAPYILIISGSISNLIDRILRGYVIDYINLEFISFPCFNISDICITIGIGFLLLNLFIKSINDRRGKN